MSNGELKVKIDQLESNLIDIPPKVLEYRYDLLKLQEEIDGLELGISRKEGEYTTIVTMEKNIETQKPKYTNEAMRKTAVDKLMRQDESVSDMKLKLSELRHKRATLGIEMDTLIHKFSATKYRIRLLELQNV